MIDGCDSRDVAHQYVRAARLPSLGVTMTEALKGFPEEDAKEAVGWGSSLERVCAECREVCTKAIRDTEDLESGLTELAATALF
jgi:hypothetical protein